MSAERGGGECWAVQTETGRGPVPGQVTTISDTCITFGDVQDGFFHDMCYVITDVHVRIF